MCGAAASSEATSCEHCGARLATVACPSCFGLMFVGQNFCPHCGTRAERPTEVKAGKMCPRCKIELVIVTLGTNKVCECTKCQGLWVDVATFEIICRNNEQQLAILGPASEAITTVNQDVVRYGRCPQCNTLMNRINFAHFSGVIVDVCRGHGTWFDKDELRKIIEFIRKGGLIAARERELENMKAEQRRATIQTSDVGMGAPISYAPCSHDIDMTELALRGCIDVIEYFLKK